VTGAAPPPRPGTGQAVESYLADVTAAPDFGIDPGPVIEESSWPTDRWVLSDGGNHWSASIAAVISFRAWTPRTARSDILANVWAYIAISLG